MQDPLKYPYNFVGLFGQVLVVARMDIVPSPRWLSEWTSFRRGNALLGYSPIDNPVRGVV